MATPATLTRCADHDRDQDLIATSAKTAEKLLMPLTKIERRPRQ